MKAWRSTFSLRQVIYMCRAEECFAKYISTVPCLPFDILEGDCEGCVLYIQFDLQDLSSDISDGNCTDVVAAQNSARTGGSPSDSEDAPNDVTRPDGEVSDDVEPIGQDGELLDDVGPIAIGPNGDDVGPIGPDGEEPDGEVPDGKVLDVYVPHCSPLQVPMKIAPAAV